MGTKEDEQWRKEKKKFAELYDLKKIVNEYEEAEEDFSEIDDFDNFDEILEFKLEEYKELNKGLKQKLEFLR